MAEFVLCRRKSTLLLPDGPNFACADLFRFDLELPVECDDEYWLAEDSEDPFKQPAGQPSNISYFVAIIQLTNVLALVLRKIVSRSIVGIYTIDD